MPGEYLQSAGEFVVVAAKPKTGWFGQSKEKQTPYIQIRFTVEDGADQGKEITWFGYLSDKAIDRTVEVLFETFGFKGDLNDLYTGKVTFEDMQARITVEREVHEGKARYKAKWLNNLNYDGPSGLDDQTTRMLIAGLNKRTMAAAKQAEANAKLDAPAKATAPKPAPVVTGGPDDDVPF